MKYKPFRDLLTNQISEAKIVLAGIPYDKGCSCGKGAAYAPDKLRELSSYLPPFTMNGIDIREAKIYDFGNIKAKNMEDIETGTKEVFNNDKFKLFFGGDHSVSYPIHKNFYKKCVEENKIPVIIHIDAHPDFCFEYDGSKYSHACPNMRSYEDGYKLDNIVLIGIRGYEDQEVEFFKKHKELKIYEASYINEFGIESMLEEIFNKYKSEYEVCISYDIDANDPSYAPGTGTPEAFGLKSIDTMKIICTLIQKLNVTCLDIVEISPKLDSNDITSWLALKTLYEVLEVVNKKF